MADQKIDFQVSANTNQAEQAFNRLAASQSKVTNGAKGNSQSMIEFGRIIQDAPYGVNAVANNVTRLAETMGVGGALMMGINLAVTGLVLLTGRTRDAKEETEKLSESAKRLGQAMRGLTTFQSFLGDKTFKIDKGNIDQVIHTLNTLINTSKLAAEAFNPNDPKKGLFNAKADKEEIGKMFSAYNSLISSGNKQRTISEEVLKILKQQKAELEAQKLISEALSAAGLQATNAQMIKLAEEKAKVEALLRGIPQQLDKISIKTAEAISASKFGKPEGMFTSRTMSASKPTVGEEAVNYMTPEVAAMQNTIFAMQDSIRNGFMQLWEDVFGQANSFLEQFIANILSGLADLAAQRMAQGIFDTVFGLLTGGASSAANIGLGAGSSAWMDARPKTTTINIELGGAPLARVVTQGNNMAERLRYN